MPTPDRLDARLMNAYLPILLALLVAIGFVLVFTAGSRYLGPRRPLPTKSSTYECGMPPLGDTRHRFSVKFYLVAVLFLLFDLEAVFLFPWATVFSDLLKAGGATLGTGLFVLGEMAFFLGVLFLGWYYLLRRGAFEWE